MRKLKKPSYRAIKKQIEHLRLENTRVQNRDLQTIRAKDETIKKLSEQADLKMIGARTDLAHALGHLIHAATDAVRFVVAKEQL